MPRSLDRKSNTTSLVPIIKKSLEQDALLSISWPLDQTIYLPDRTILEPSVNVKVLKSRKCKESQVELYVTEEQKSGHPALRESLGVFRLTELSKLKIDVNSSNICGCRVKIDDFHLGKAHSIVQNFGQCTKTVALADKCGDNFKRNLALVRDSFFTSCNQEKNCMNRAQGYILKSCTCSRTNKNKKSKGKGNCKERSSSCKRSKSIRPQKEKIDTRRDCFSIERKPSELNEVRAPCVLVRKDRDSDSQKSVKFEKLIEKSLSSLCCALQLNAADVEQFQENNKACLWSVLRQTEHNIKCAVQCHGEGKDATIKLINGCDGSSCSSIILPKSQKMCIQCKQSSNSLKTCSKPSTSSIISSIPMKCKYTCSKLKKSESSTNSLVSCNHKRENMTISSKSLANSSKKRIRTNTSTHSFINCKCELHPKTEDTTNLLKKCRKPKSADSSKKFSKTNSSILSQCHCDVCKKEKKSPCSSVINNSSSECRKPNKCSKTNTSDDSSRIIQCDCKVSGKTDKSVKSSITSDNSFKKRTKYTTHDSCRSNDSSKKYKSSDKTLSRSNTVHSYLSSTHGNSLYQRISHCRYKTPSCNKPRQVSDHVDVDGGLFRPIKCLNKLKKILEGKEKPYFGDMKPKSCEISWTAIDDCKRTHSECICKGWLMKSEHNPNDHHSSSEGSTNANIVPAYRYKNRKIPESRESYNCTDTKVSNRSKFTQNCKISSCTCKKCNRFCKCEKIFKQSISFQKTSSSISSFSVRKKYSKDKQKSINRHSKKFQNRNSHKNKKEEKSTKYLCSCCRKSASLRLEKTAKECENDYIQLLNKLKKTLEHQHRSRCTFSDPSNTSDYKYQDKNMKEGNACIKEEKRPSSSRCKTLPLSRLHGACTCQSLTAVKSILSVIKSKSNSMSCTCACKKANSISLRKRNDYSPDAKKRITQVSENNVLHRRSRNGKNENEKDIDTCRNKTNNPTNKSYRACNISRRETIQNVQNNTMSAHRHYTVKQGDNSDYCSAKCSCTKVDPYKNEIKLKTSRNSKNNSQYSKESTDFTKNNANHKTKNEKNRKIPKICRICSVASRSSLNMERKHVLNNLKKKHTHHGSSNKLKSQIEECSNTKRIAKSIAQLISNKSRCRKEAKYTEAMDQGDLEMEVQSSAKSLQFNVKFSEKANNKNNITNTNHDYDLKVKNQLQCHRGCCGVKSNSSNNKDYKIKCTKYTASQKISQNKHLTKQYVDKRLKKKRKKFNSCSPSSKTDFDLESDYPLLDSNNKLKCKIKKKSCKTIIQKAKSNLAKKNSIISCNIKRDHTLFDKELIINSKKEGEGFYGQRSLETENRFTFRKVKLKRSDKCLKLKENDESSIVKPQTSTDNSIACMCSSYKMKCQCHATTKYRTTVNKKSSENNSIKDNKVVKFCIKPNPSLQKVLNQSHSVEHARIKICLKEEKMPENVEGKDMMNIKDEHQKCGVIDMPSKCKHDPSSPKVNEFLNEIKTMHNKIVQKCPSREKAIDNGNNACKSLNRIEEEKKCENEGKEKSSVKSVSQLQFNPQARLTTKNTCQSPKHPEKKEFEIIRLRLKSKCNEKQGTCKSIDICEKEKVIHVEPTDKSRTELQCSDKVECNFNNKRKLSKRSCKSFKSKKSSTKEEQKMWSELKNIMKLVFDTKQEGNKSHTKSINCPRGRNSKRDVQFIKYNDKTTNDPKQNKCLHIFDVNTEEVCKQKRSRSSNKENSNVRILHVSKDKSESKDVCKPSGGKENKHLETAHSVISHAATNKSSPTVFDSTHLSHTEIYYSRNKGTQITDPVKKPMAKRVFGKNKLWKSQGEGKKKRTKENECLNTTDDKRSNQYLSKSPSTYDTTRNFSKQSNKRTKTRGCGKSTSPEKKVLSKVDLLTTDQKIDNAFNSVYNVLEKYFNENQSLLDTMHHLKGMDNLTELLEEINFASNYPMYLREQSLCEMERFEENFERFVAMTKEVTCYHTFNERLTHRTSSLSTVHCVHPRPWSSQIYENNRISLIKDRWQLLQDVCPFSAMPVNQSFQHGIWKHRSKQQC